jgi:hypothetical protein
MYDLVLVFSNKLNNFERRYLVTIDHVPDSICSTMLIDQQETVQDNFCNMKRPDLSEEKMIFGCL